MNRPVRNKEKKGRTRFHPARGEEGIALLVAIFMVVLLVTMAVEFDYGTRVSFRVAANFRDGIQAAYLAESGVQAARAALKEDSRQDQKNPPAHDGTDELWATPLAPYPVGAGFVQVEIADESGKLNVNAMHEAEGYTRWGPVWARLFELLEIDRQLVDSIRDWVDTDADEGGFYGPGAESGYYERLDPPYRAKNGKMESLGELRLIRGVTDEVYKKLMTGCDGKPCFTVAPATQLNLNTVSPKVCQALHEDLTEDLCRRMVEGRPFGAVNDLDAVAGWGGTGGGTASGSGIRPELITRGISLSVSSQYFLIGSRGEVNETRRSVEALVQRQGSKVSLLKWLSE